MSHRVCVWGGDVPVRNQSHLVEGGCPCKGDIKWGRATQPCPPLIDMQFAVAPADFGCLLGVNTVAQRTRDVRLGTNCGALTHQQTPPLPPGLTR